MQLSHYEFASTTEKGENDHLSKYLFMRCHKTAIEMSERRIRQEPLWRFHCHDFDNIS